MICLLLVPSLYEVSALPGVGFLCPPDLPPPSCICLPSHLETPSAPSPRLIGQVPSVMTDVHIPPEENDDDVFCTISDCSGMIGLTFLLLRFYLLGPSLRLALNK